MPERKGGSGASTATAELINRDSSAAPTKASVSNGKGRIRNGRDGSPGASGLRIKKENGE